MAGQVGPIRILIALCFSRPPPDTAHRRLHIMYMYNYDRDENNKYVLVNRIRPVFSASKHTRCLIYIYI